jgi:hypothetical protein
LGLWDLRLCLLRQLLRLDLWGRRRNLLRLVGQLGLSDLRLCLRHLADLWDQRLCLPHLLDQLGLWDRRLCFLLLLRQ